MKREYLKAIGIDEEKIDLVMAEYGKSVQGLKEEVERLESIDNESELSTLKQQLEEKEGELLDLKAQHEQDLTNYKIDAKIQSTLTDAKARDIDLVASLLDKESIHLTDSGDIEGLDEQLTNIKEAKAFLFESDEAPEVFGSTPAGTEHNDASKPDAFDEVFAKYN